MGQVQSLVGELRSRKPHGVATKQKKHKGVKNKLEIIREKSTGECICIADSLCYKAENNTPL